MMGSELNEDFSEEQFYLLLSHTHGDIILISRIGIM